MELENTNANYQSVTEVAGDEVSQEQVQRISNRYAWARRFCKGKDVLEVACGTGQGLGLLAAVAKSVSAGDIDAGMVEQAKRHYGSRASIEVMDAQNLPFPDASKDLILLFEAIYYVPNVDKFLDECRRVLRPGGNLLIVTCNKDLFDFNPSPFSVKYFGVVELQEILERHGFTAKFYGDSPVQAVSMRQKVLRPVKKFAVDWGLMPKTMAGKKLLKRLVFGKLVPMPAELPVTAEMETEPTPLQVAADRSFKVLYCEGILPVSN